MTETEVKIYGNGEKRVNIYLGEEDYNTHGSIAFGFENTSSGFMIRTKIAGSSQVMPHHEICYTLKRNEAYVLLGAVEAYLKMQPKKQELTEL